MKRVFEIEYPEDFGPFWMNVDNLMICLRTKEFIGPKVPIKVRDVTDKHPIAWMEEEDKLIFSEEKDEA